MRKIFLILFLNFVMLSFSNVLWLEAPEASITIFENATPLNKASFVINNVAFTYKGSYEIVENSTKGYLVVFEAINTSDSKVFLNYKNIGEVFDKSKIYTSLDQYSFYILKYDIQLIFNSYFPKKSLLVGFFIPEPPEKIVGINFLNHYYKWNDKYVLPIENLIEKTKEDTKTANTILKFRGFPLTKTTINDVEEKEGKPLNMKTENNVTNLLYTDEIFGRTCYVMYRFYNDLLFEGGYLFTFEAYETTEMSRIFKKLKEVLNEKYGKGEIKLSGFAKEYVEDIDNEEAMLYVVTQALKIYVIWYVNPELQHEVSLFVSGSIKDLKAHILVMYMDRQIYQKVSGSDDNEEEKF